MKKIHKINSFPLVLLLMAATLSQFVQAASCTSSGFVNTHTVSATLDGAISSNVGSGVTDGCTAIATGNLAQQSADLPLSVFGETWTLIEKDVLADAVSSALHITSTASDGDGSIAGNWYIDLGAVGDFNTFVIGLKPDGGFAYWNVGNTLSGTYSDLTHALSHANLYGRLGGSPPSGIPLPAAVWLFGSSMLGLIGFTRRKA